MNLNKACLICMAGALGLLSSGCFPGHSIRNIDQVPRDSAWLWQKPDGTRLDVQRALLECGALSPSGGTVKQLEQEYGDEAGMLNHSIRLSACMEKAGYKNKLIRRYNVESYAEFVCNNWKKRYTLPACQPGAPVMERSVERRLNSRFCRLQRDYQFCKANAYKPEACDKRVSPDPICLP